MKKVDFKSVIIGCLVMTCMFLFMGQSKETVYFKKIYVDEIFLGDDMDKGTYLNSEGLLIANSEQNTLVGLSPFGVMVTSYDMETWYATLGIDDYNNGTLQLLDKYGTVIFSK